MTWRYWLFAGGTLLLVVFLGYNTYLSARLLRTWRPTGNLLLLPAENLLRLGLILLCLGLGWASGLDWQQLGWTWVAPRTALLAGLLWGGGLALFFYLTMRWIVAHGGTRLYSPLVIEAITPHNHRELIGVALAMIGVVCLEELLFRSLLLGGLQPLLPWPVLLIGWSILFGLFHSPQGIWGMIGAGLGGLILGGLFLHQQSLATPLVAHYVTNLVQVVQAMRLRRQQPEGTYDADPVLANDD